MSDWYRIDLDGAPQGHGLATSWKDSTFVAWETDDGWYVKRIYENGFQTKAARANDFSEVREGVEYAKQANPQVPSNGGYVRVGIGALLGTVTGMALGGLPGIIKKNEALATVGAQIGGVLGAAAGAVVAHGTQPRDTADPSIQELKGKLLK